MAALRRHVFVSGLTAHRSLAFLELNVSLKSLTGRRRPGGNCRPGVGPLNVATLVLKMLLNYIAHQPQEWPGNMTVVVQLHLDSQSFPPPALWSIHYGDQESVRTYAKPIP